MGLEKRRPQQADPLAGAAADPSGLLDLLGVAAVLLEADGKIDMWSPQAEELFGYTGGEAVGQYAAPLLLHPEHQDAAVTLFAEVMRTGRRWAGPSPSGTRTAAPG